MRSQGDIGEFWMLDFVFLAGEAPLCGEIENDLFGIVEQKVLF